MNILPPCLTFTLVPPLGCPPPTSMPTPPTPTPAEPLGCPLGSPLPGCPPPTSTPAPLPTTTPTLQEPVGNTIWKTKQMLILDSLGHGSFWQNSVPVYIRS